jgi:hypothetical protein
MRVLIRGRNVSRGLLMAAAFLAYTWALAVWVNHVAEAQATIRVCEMVRPHFVKEDVCFGILP